MQAVFVVKDRMLQLLVALVSGAGPVLASDVAGEESEKARTDPAADYADELPRVPPLEPAASLAAFHVTAGFRLELAAAEPLVVDPVAISFDARGRLYAVCMRGYSEQRDEALGQVRLLEDADGDGRFDASTVFLDGLSWPTGVACWQGGVYVAAAPDIIYAKDTEGDGRADDRRVVYTGFGHGDVQGLLNSLSWGLDNRIHGATSSSGGKVRTPGAPDSEPLDLRGRDFAFDPRSGKLEATSGGAQHGMSFDDWGRKFVCSNSRHLEMVMFDERYLRRNRHLAAPGPRKLIAVDGGQAEVFRRSAVEPWRIVRTRLRVAGTVPGPVEGGGRAAGYFTGATGVTVYRGDALPVDLRGQAFIGDVGSNIVHRKRLVPYGVGFRAERIDKGREFVASDEIWFRPVQFANAPDGALYVLDMYREVIEHPDSLPPTIKKHLDLTSGRDRGRIYRVVPERFRQPRLARLDRSTASELVAALEHPNGWRRDTAARLLYERQDRSAVGPLQGLVVKGDVPLGRLHALHALDGLGALTIDTVLRALSDPHARVREHAVRLAERFTAASAEVCSRLYALARDPDLRVRYQLAFTLGEVAGSGRYEALARIARQDAADPWMRLAVLSSLADGAGAVFALLADDVEFRRSTPGRRMLAALASTIGTSNQKDAIADVLGVLDDLPPEDTELAAVIVREMGEGSGNGGAPWREALRSGEGAGAAILTGLLDEARRTLLQGQAGGAARAEAARTLALGKFAAVEDTLGRLLDSREPHEVQLAAIAALSRFDEPAVATAILAAWPGFSPRLRAPAVEALFARPERLPAVLDALEAKELLPADLPASRLQMLREHPDADIRERAVGVLAGVERRGRLAVVEEYRDALQLPADRERGKAVFRKICAACHEVEGFGNEIGPNLLAMRGRGAEALLLGVLDPNREVHPQYVNYVLVTRDGRTMTGLIASETATSVTLRRGENQSDTVLRLDIATLKSTGLSIMPEDLETEIDKQAMADLIDYLLAAR